MATAHPKTLQQAIEFFAVEQNCRDYVVSQRWPDGQVACPMCGSTDVAEFTSVVRRKGKVERTRRVFECRAKHARRQFTLKTGTVMEDSPIALKSWLLAMWMIANCKNGVSSYEVHRAIGITQKSAWFLLHRIRLAMQAKAGGKLVGEIEVDETFIGQKARNMRWHKRKATMQGRKAGQIPGRIAVMGVLQRGTKGRKSRVRLEPVAKVKRHHLEPIIHANVESGATVYSDGLPSYDQLHADYVHQVISHAQSYAIGQVHINGIENFWALLKRSLGGTYISVEPFHLFRYLDEQSFRFNERETNDATRFAMVVGSVVGKRLTYAELTAKEAHL